MKGEEVKWLRDALGLNQVRFALLVGVHPMTVSKWERGAARPSPLAEHELRRLRIEYDNYGRVV